jgi:hypothetical protein
VLYYLEMLDMTANWSRRLVNALLLAAVVISTFCLNSCVSADAVAKFASDAAKSLNQGTAVINDFPESVVRRDCDQNVEKRAFNFTLPEEACVVNSIEQANLAQAKKDRDDVIAVQKVLIDYFNALQQLAAFGKASDSTGKSKDDKSAADSSANKLKTSGKLTSSDEVKAVTTLGDIMVKAFSAGYRNRELSRDLKAADDAVGNVVDALTHIVKDDYMYNPNYKFDLEHSQSAPLLNFEAHRMTEEYMGADASPILLKISWTDRSQELLARNSSANSYVEALAKIKGGHHTLATEPTHLKAQSLVASLQPYISGLESLIPQIQKVF